MTFERGGQGHRVLPAQGALPAGVLLDLHDHKTTTRRRGGRRVVLLRHPRQVRAAAAEGELLEWAVVHGINSYGTPRGPVLGGPLPGGQQVVLEIDLQGARQVKENLPEARLIFLAPPSWDELEPTQGAWHGGRGHAGPQARHGQGRVAGHGRGGPRHRQRAPR